jgi:hypothetical protein
MSATSVTLEPAKWYDVTARDDNEACEHNYGRTFDINPCYSNGGTVTIECGLCKQLMTIISAVMLDPQPEFS